MKIAIYSGNIPSTTFIENLIYGLSNGGFEIFLFGRKSGEVKYNDNVKIYDTPENATLLILFLIKESVMLLIRNPKLFFKCITLVRKKNSGRRKFLRELGTLLPILSHQPDIFHIQWGKTVERFPELFELLKSKFVLSLRGAHINYSPLTNNKLAEAYKKYFPGIEKFHAVSKAIADEALKYKASIDKISVIHSSVKDEFLKMNPDVFDKKDTIKVISVGRFHWKKGYHYALDAFKQLSDQNISFEYTIIAQGEIPEEIIFLINEYKLQSKVKIIQGMSHEKLLTKLCESHVLILPSVEEGIANVVLEAMAAGVPVITSDCGGMNEAVRDNYNGYVVPLRRPELLAEKIKDFISSNIESKKKIVANARNTIEENFSSAKQIREFSEFYKSMIV